MRLAVLVPLLIAPLALIAQPAFAAEMGSCKLSPDKKSVSVMMSNPYSQQMQCEVNCNMGIPGGFATVVCVKPVPVGTKDQVMCTEDAGAGKIYTAVKDSEINCPDPSAPPKPAAAKDSSDDDDDAAVEAQMKKMQEQGLEMLKRMKKQ